MIDLHCHILPEIDDGAASLDEALSMARFCVADGITHITATPHCNRVIRSLRADVLPRVAALNDALARAGVALTVLPGSEVQVTDTDEYQSDYEAGLLCHLGDRPDFTLFEVPWRAERCPPGVANLVRWMRDRGTTPILAHPERHPYLNDDATRLRALVDAGAWLQVTVDSLLGNHGPNPWALAGMILRDYTDNIVLSTDAHNLRRCSGLSAGYRWISEHLGAARADAIRASSDHVLTRLAG